MSAFDFSIEKILSKSSSTDKRKLTDFSPAVEPKISDKKPKLDSLTKILQSKASEPSIPNPLPLVDLSKILPLIQSNRDINLKPKPSTQATLLNTRTYATPNLFTSTSKNSSISHPPLTSQNVSSDELISDKFGHINENLDRIVNPVDMPKTHFSHSTQLDESLKNVTCVLENSHLWHRFYNLGTEMIITKAGRRMFPPLKIIFKNFMDFGPTKSCNSKLQSSLPSFLASASGNAMSKNSKKQEDNFVYHVIVDTIPLNDKRYRYAYHKSAWLIAGKSEEKLNYTAAIHHDGPFTQDKISEVLLSFDKIKLTNSEHHTKNGFILLTSMHRYVPRVHLVKIKKSDPIFNDKAQNIRNNFSKMSTSSHHFNLPGFNNLDLDFCATSSSSSSSKTNSNSLIDRNLLIIKMLELNPYKSFIFNETQFTAVTAYQNQLITRLKIESNPFAKGFRENGNPTSSALANNYNDAILEYQNSEVLRRG